MSLLLLILTSCRHHVPRTTYVHYSLRMRLLMQLLLLLLMLTSCRRRVQRT